MKQTTLHFHTGRGGRFNNPGHRTFEGIESFSNLIQRKSDYLFRSFENIEEAEEAVEENPELEPILSYAVESGDGSEFEKETSIDLGEYVLTDSAGHVLLTAEEANEETGYIEWDNDYDADKVIYLEDATDEDMQIVNRSGLYDATELVRAWVEMKLDRDDIEWDRIDSDDYRHIIDGVDSYGFDIEDWYQEEDAE